MITIFCGDNTVLSRDALIQRKHNLIKSGNYIQTIDATRVLEIIKSGGSDAVDLFTGAPIYETTNLITSLRKSFTKKAKERLRNIAQDSTIQLLDWEDTSAYDLGIDKDKFTFVHEFKMSESIFTLLPALVPGKKTDFLRILKSVSEFQQIELTFSMIVRHCKLMIALSTGIRPKDNPYLIRLAQSSLSHWPKESLLKFYYRLLTIDLNVKTGRNTPLNLKQQLEILVSFVL